MKKNLLLAFIAVVLLNACSQMEQLHSASLTANKNADKTMYQPVTYANRAKKGPALIVIPGNIKSTNATFKQKYTSNNIADFGELELGNANFRVFERSDLGPVLDEIALAANMGNARKVRKKLKRGKFKTTQWFVKFDVLKAEHVASAETGADFETIGRLLAMTGNRKAGVATSSVETAQTAGVWVIGMRYKVIDANSTELVTQGYFEDKMEIGSTSTSIMGFRQGQKNQVTLDSMVQRLVQQAVADLDQQK